jgi:hypothetical protein
VVAYTFRQAMWTMFVFFAWILSFRLGSAAASTGSPVQIAKARRLERGAITQAEFDEFMAEGLAA